MDVNTTRYKLARYKSGKVEVENMFSKVLKTSLLPFLILIPIVTLFQYFILAPHLRYGFADVDWNFLLSYKNISLLNHDPINHFLFAWRTWGVYTYQVYYIGLIQKFFGMDYINFQIVTHVFKIIATLSIYPLIYLVTKSKLAAFLTTIIYAVAYSSVGVMYTVVTSGLFVAVPVMSLFLIWYWHLINKEENSTLDIFIAVVLFFSTLILATERMYPLVPIVALIEGFWWYKNNFSKKVLIQIIKRLTIFIAIFIVMFLSKPSTFTGFFGNTVDTYVRLRAGNWQVIMSPIISLGSLFLPRDYWKYLGVPNIDNLFAYIGFIISGPLLTFTIITTFLSIFLSKKKRKFIASTLILTFIFSILIYILSSHQLYIPESVKMHFDIATIIPAFIGGFMISLIATLFKEWINQGRKDNLVISMIGGVVIALIFIVLTWVATDYTLIFTGVHRYLTLPSIGSSLFIAGLITIIFRKLYDIKATKVLSYLTFLVLILIILFNATVIKDYFNYELSYAGTDAAGHIRMKNKLWSYLGGISKTEASIFYFDESADHDNGYFDETTIMAGFNSWMRVKGYDIISDKVMLGLLRSNLMCIGERSMCLSKVQELVTQRDGEKGIFYGGTFYKLKNFYAFRFVNRDIVDIKPEVVEAIGLY